MKRGDHIKHVDDNTGEGPNGAWTIEHIDREGLIYFVGGSHAPYEWIITEIEMRNAKLISNGEMVERYIEPHMVGGLMFNP